MRHTWPLLIVALAVFGCSGDETTDGDSGKSHTEGPGDGSHLPRPILERTDVPDTLLEVARLEDAKTRDGGRLAALLASDPDARVRRAAAMALGHIHDPADAPALLAAYGDADESVVEAALFATGLLHKGDERPPVAPLLPMLAHASARVRAAAVEAVGRIGDVEAAEAIHALLADDDPLVRGEAALASWRVARGADKLAELDEESTDEDRAAHEAALADRARVHAAVLPIARAAKTETDATARWRMVFAVQDLRRSPPRSGPEPPELSDAERTELGELAAAWITDPERRVREVAVLLAGRVLGEEAGGVIAPGLADDVWQVRVRSLDAVRISKAKGVLATVRSLAASDPHHLVRRSALQVLGSQEDEGALEIVQDGLRAESATVRRTAVGVLAELLGADALEELAPFLADADPWTRTAAIAAVGDTLGEEPDPAHVDDVVGLLAPRLASGSEREQAAVLEAAANLPIEPACDFIERGLAVDVLEVRGNACSALADLAEDIRESGRDLWPAIQAAWDGSQDADEYELRQNLLDAAGELGGDAAEALLRTGLADPHRAVRESAAKALSKLTDTEVEAPDGPPPPAPGRPDAAQARLLDLPTRLRIQTNKGDLVLELFVDDAPMHVFNLVTLARKGFYDGLIWHRVENGFVIQGGCPRRTGWGDPGYTINNEVNMRRYEHGVLGMPDAGLDTGGCQLFINHTPWPSLDGRYTVYGRVIEGLDVVDRIEVGDQIIRVRDE